MAEAIDIRPPLGRDAEGISEIPGPSQPSGVEEDDSVSSSTSPEIFDREPRILSSVESKKPVGAANWLRYGSSESATSTAISSVCSSRAADEKTDTSELSPRISTSRKRLSDGTLKPSYVARDAALSAPVKDVHQSAGSISQSTQHQPPVAKRRGRPPKNKTNEVAQPPKAATKESRSSQISQLQGQVRPRSSIPYRLPVNVFAGQCIEAAYAARLSPYSLHTGEHDCLADLLTSKEVTVYLNIRNAILRLWHQNPLCSITPQEAAGCAKEGRFFGLAEVAYNWLVRNGYINFGCVEVPHDPVSFRQTRKTSNQKTIVVIGAGVSGLTTARQLEGLFAQGAHQWTDVGERPPRVIILEGRRRIGGRVYSKPLRSQAPGSLPGDLRNTAEMGAMIVTGFEHGNPLNTVIRGQLGLRYHLMRDALTIYDCNGKPVNENRDMLNTELYTDISDRAGEYRALSHKPTTLGGDEGLINRCRDPAAEGLEAFQLEVLDDPAGTLPKHKPASRRGRRRNAPPGTEKLTGRTRVLEGSNATQSATRAAREMGWQPREGISKTQTVALDAVARATSHPTLGAVMDEAIEQYQDIIDLTAQDMRLLNWHHANLEYANAAPVSWLSLSGHDQDTGNEFEGAHSEIIGGYTQLPQGLMNLPTELDVRFDRIVESVHYNATADAENGYTTKVVCTDGETIEADQVVVTAPLGVLKSDMIDFDPPLPAWKQGAIERMGFGLLNKVILLYDKPFWDDSRDMFGLLNEAEHEASLDPQDYERRRGRFYLIWNASRISGRPMLVALMAGFAAHDAEHTDSSTLLSEINGRLRTVFDPETVPAPLEAIVTRWKKDPFTRGTYSYVGSHTKPGDYDLMARPVGNLHFAGEATCGTHPATVHGAFLSGLRVAAEVMDCMAGPISLPSPLVGPLQIIKQEWQTSAPPASPRRALQPAASWGRLGVNGPNATPNAAVEQEPISQSSPSAISMANGYAPPFQQPAGPPKQSVCAFDDSFWARPMALASDTNYEASITGAITAQLGERPPKPARPGVNPFLLYTKDQWEGCKAHCAARDASGSAAPAGRDLIRATLGKWWRALSDADKRPYLARSRAAQDQADVLRREWEARAAVWDREARRIRGEMLAQRADTAAVGSESEGAQSWGALTSDGLALGVSRRKTNTSNCVVLDGL